VDKQLDFWSAMELSRKVVTKHWFKFLGFGLVLWLLLFAGAVALGFGLLVMTPLVLAALMHAYEDIFCDKALTAIPPVAGIGPFGTVVQPATPPRIRSGWWTPMKVGLTVVALVIGLLALMILIRLTHFGFRRDIVSGRPARQQMELQAPEFPINPPGPLPSTDPAEPIADPAHFVFGPVIERELQARGTNQFLNLATEQLLTTSAELASVLAANQPGENENRFWQALDIPADSRRFQYVSWLRESGVDLMYAGNGKIIGFDGIFAMAHGDSSTNWDDWDGLTPEQARAAADVVDWSRSATEAQLHGQPAPPPPTAGGIYRSAIQLDSREAGGPIVNLLTRDQSVTWFFKTRAGTLGILQLASFSDNLPGARIRYKLVQQTNDQGMAVAEGASKTTRETLEQRLAAASMMNNFSAKDKAIATVATDAAKAGEVDLVEDSVRQITDYRKRNQTAQESSRLLAKRGQRKQALAIAKSIEDVSIRDQALSELAH